MKDNIDEIIKKTLQKDIKPSATLNQSVLEKVKEMEDMKKEKSNIVKVHNHRKIVKAAAIAGAILLVGGGTAYAASNFYNTSLVVGEKEISQDVDCVHVNNIKAEELRKNYFNISDVEKILGIKLLKSDQAYQSEIADISISQYEDKSINVYSISDTFYIVKDMERDLSQDKEGFVWKDIGECPYTISYEARICVSAGENTGFVDSYENSSFKEEYKTKNGVVANIFSFGGEYIAYVVKDNIEYTFEMCSSSKVDDETKLQELKLFLDSLS